MADLEKAIKGLETCIKYIDRECPIWCPYHEVCTKRVGHVVLQPLFIDALDLLKEKEPKAIEYHDNPFTGLPVAHCPNCERYAQQFYASVEEETHYCPWCGQEVKWDAID